MTSCSTRTNIRINHLIGNNLEAKRSGANTTLFCLHDFRCRSGELVAIVGRNGAGKSTLLRYMVGEPSLPILGTLLLNDQPIAAIENPFQDGVMAWLPQQKIPMFDATALQVVLAGRYRHKHFWQPYHTSDYDICQKAMATCGVAHLANTLMTKLSGGEQQLVWLAQVAVQDADLVLLDEPTQHLDLYNKRKVMDIINGWAANGKLVLFSTHDLYLLPAYDCQLLYLNPSQCSVTTSTTAEVKRVIDLIELG